MRRFTGSVVAEGGELKSLKRIDVESESRVVYPGRAPHVVLDIDGRAMPNLVEVGKENHKPGSLPVFVRLK